MSLARFVEVTSSNAARESWGSTHARGQLLPVVMPISCSSTQASKSVLGKDDFHISDYSIWEDFPIQGWPVTTILRGKVVVDNGQLLGSQGDGNYMSRKVEARIVDRPAV